MKFLATSLKKVKSTPKQKTSKPYRRLPSTQQTNSDGDQIMSVTEYMRLLSICGEQQKLSALQKDLQKDKPIEQQEPRPANWKMIDGLPSQTEKVEKQMAQLELNDDDSSNDSQWDQDPLNGTLACMIEGRQHIKKEKKEIKSHMDKAKRTRISNIFIDKIARKSAPVVTGIKMPCEIPTVSQIIYDDNIPRVVQFQPLSFRENPTLRSNIPIQTKPTLINLNGARDYMARYSNINEYLELRTKRICTFYGNNEYLKYSYLMTNTLSLHNYNLLPDQHRSLLYFISSGVITELPNPWAIIKHGKQLPADKWPKATTSALFNFRYLGEHLLNNFILKVSLLKFVDVVFVSNLYKSLELDYHMEPTEFVRAFLYKTRNQELKDKLIAPSLAWFLKRSQCFMFPSEEEKFVDELEKVAMPINFLVRLTKIKLRPRQWYDFAN